MSDIRETFLVCASLVVCFCSFVGAVTFYNLRSDRMYVEGGYEQRTLQGASGAYWVKIEK